MSIVYETMRVAELCGDPENPRRMPEAAAEGLAESLRTFGVVQPPVYNRRTGQLVAGHQRVEALRADGVAEVTVAVGSWTPEEQRALNVALNNPALQGKFTGDVESYLAEVERTLEPAKFRKMRFATLFKPKRKAESQMDDLQYQIVVECDDEQHQARLIEDMQARGLKARPVIL